MEVRSPPLNSNWQTFALLVKGNIGPGCLALPFSFSMLGAAGSLPFLLVVAVLCIGNMWILVQCKRRVWGAKTYGELGFHAFGRRGEVLVEVFLTMSQLSICCVYISFISNGIAPMIGVSSQLLSLLLIFPIAVICQYRHMRDLAPLSMIASGLLVCAMLIIGFVCVHKLASPGESVIVPMFDSSKIVLFFVSTVYAFEGIGIILPIECSMQTPSHFTRILVASMCIVTVIYISFGEIVILAFGVIEDAGITKFLVTIGSVPVVLASVISVFVSLAVLLSYPLQLYPALQVLEIYFGLAIEEDTTRDSFASTSSTQYDDATSPWYSFYLSKARNIIIFLKILKGDYDDTLIYPSPEYKRKIKHTRIYSYQGGSSFEDNCTSHPSPILHTVCDDTSHPLVHKSHSMTEIEMNRYRTLSVESEKVEGCDINDFEEKSASQFFSTYHDHGESRIKQHHRLSDISFIRSSLRCTLVVFTSLVAAFIPNIGMLVSLAGASSGTCLALIFPPLLEVAISKKQQEKISSFRLAFCILSICIGVFGAIVGSILSLMTILSTIKS